MGLRLLSRVAILSAVASVALLAAAPADAHFVLQKPANWLPQDPNGLPIKLAPCGDEQDGTIVPTNVVTTYQEGSTISITIDEVIFHPGHYRIALVDDRSKIPAEPKVDAGADSPCGSAAVSTPVFPVLADGVLDHDTAFDEPQTIQVKLPDGFTCAHCTLQVLEFMGKHGLNDPGGCFYHHCADLAITSEPVADGGVVVTNDGGAPPPSGVDAGSGSDGDIPDNSDPALDTSSGGCGCSTPGSGSSSAFGLGGLVLGLVALRSLRRKKKR